MELNSTSRSGSLTGNFFSSTVSTTLNRAVLAPMPSASVKSAIAVKPGFFQNICKPYRKSCQRLFTRFSSVCLFVSQCHQGIDFRRAPRRDVAREQGDGEQYRGRRHEGRRIVWPDAI